MRSTLSTCVCFIAFGLITGCADLQKAELAFQQENYTLAREQWQDLAALGFPKALLGLGKLAELSPHDQGSVALEYFQNAYELGYDPAAYQIGQYYYKHPQNQEDLELARQWILKAAEQGSLGAYLLYGDMQLYGRGEVENIETALSIYRDLAEHGYALASRRLAYIYEKGFNVEKNKVEAFDYFKQAFSQGSIESELDIGRYFANGYAGDTDFDKAESIFQRFAESENPQAAYLLGDLYQRRFVIERKPLLGQSVDWFKFSAERGYIPAKIRLIDLMLEGNPKNIESVVEKLKNLSKLNEGKASYRLGRLFSTGKIADNNKEELKYYQLAYNQGYELAAYRIAEYYFVNQKNHQDLHEAQQWLQKALQQQSDNARFVQAELTLHGYGLQQNITKAIEIFRALSNEGMSSASRTLAKIYENGSYTDQNFQQALFYFERAASHGDTYAELDVARFYADGLGVNSDWQRAKSIFQHYAEAGYHKAAYLLAKNLEQHALTAGQEIPEQAVRWYRAAANQNNISAQLRLIDMMLDGQGLTRDIDKAKAELTLLSEQGVAEASFRLGALYAEEQNETVGPSLRYYQLAFLQGSQKSVSKLARFYQQGYGLKNNAIRTTYTNFANAGNINAAYLLGVLYESHSGPKQALHWYQKAAEQNHIEAQMALVNMYSKTGKMKTAHSWLLKAAQARNGKAMLRYGEALFWGHNMKADKIQGLAYVLSAARLHIGGAVSKSLKLMSALNNAEQIELANQRSK